MIIHSLSVIYTSTLFRRPHTSVFLPQHEMPTQELLNSCSNGFNGKMPSSSQIVQSQPKSLFLFEFSLFKSSPSIFLARSDGCHVIRYHFRTFSLDLKLRRPSANCQRDTILAVHPIRPPCPPICLHTLLLSDLDCLFTLHPPDLMVLMLFFSPTSSPRHSGLRTLSSLDIGLT